MRQKIKRNESLHVAGKGRRGESFVIIKKKDFLCSIKNLVRAIKIDCISKRGFLFSNYFVHFSPFSRSRREKSFDALVAAINNSL